MRGSAFGVFALGLLAGIIARPAWAGDGYYPHVNTGSPLYQPTPVVTANIDIFGGIVTGSGTSASGTAGTLGGIGRANISLQGGWNVQVDVQGIETSQYDFLDKSAFNLSHLNAGAYAYLYKRVGAFQIGPYIGTEMRGSGDLVGKFFGFFCGPDFGQWELHGFATVGWLTDGTNTGSSYGGQAGAQYWLDGNTSLGADVALNHFHFPYDNTSVVTAAFTALHRFADKPIAVFGQLRIDSYSGDTRATLSTAVAGMRFYANPGAGDARTDSQNGPAITTRLALPTRL